MVIKNKYTIDNVEIDSFNNNPQKINYYINNMFKLLLINEKNLKIVENQNLIQRTLGILFGANKRKLKLNERNLEEIQKLSIGVLTELEKQNMITRDNQMLIYNKVNEIYYKQVELKEFINEALIKIIDRFEKIEAKINLHTLILELDGEKYSALEKHIALIYILGIINKAEWQEERNIDILLCKLKEKDIFTNKLIDSKKLLYDLVCMDKGKIYDIYLNYKSINGNSFIDFICKALKLALDKDEKEDIELEKILNIISENNISDEINIVDIGQVIIREFRSKTEEITDKLEIRDNVLKNDDLKEQSNDNLDHNEDTKDEDKGVFNTFKINMFR